MNTYIARLYHTQAVLSETDLVKKVFTPEAVADFEAKLNAVVPQNDAERAFMDALKLVYSKTADNLYNTFQHRNCTYLSLIVNGRHIASMFGLIGHVMITWNTAEGRYKVELRQRSERKRGDRKRGDDLNV